MQNRNVGLVVAALAVVAAVALFVVLREDDEGDTETTTAQTTTQANTTTDEQTATNEQTTTKEQTATEKPEVATIVVKGGQPAGGVQELGFAEGEDVRFVVEADTEDEVHLHGYNLTEEVAPGRPAKFAFAATEPGVFELELHHAVTQIAEITVE